MIKRVITIVLDGFGVGELPDSKDYKDEGSNTLAGIYHNTKLNLTNLKKIGLYHIDGVELEENKENAIGNLDFLTFFCLIDIILSLTVEEKNNRYNA